MNDRIDTRPYFMLIPTERRIRAYEFANSFMDMASAFLPGSKPIMKLTTRIVLPVLIFTTTLQRP